LRARLQKQGLSLQVTPATKQYLLEHGYDIHSGVRPLRRLIQDTIEDQVAVKLLDEEYQRGDIIQVGARDGKLAYATLHE
jgi:ATP-dependent Clp protease ATP-binding subunit ClpB